MPRTGIDGSYTPSPQRVPQTLSDSSLNADLLFLQAWEANPSMNLGVMLRIRQIRRANSQLPAEIAAIPARVKNGYFE
jgi:hypothetical protein